MTFVTLQEGLVYAVEFSHRSGRDLVNMAKKRTNVIPIIEDARHPASYRMLIGMVDVIFSDVAQPDQVCSHLTHISVLGLMSSRGDIGPQQMMSILGFPFHDITMDDANSSF